MAEFGLSERALQLLRTAFSANLGIERAIVYGSRAKGNFRPGSDIDVMLDGRALTSTDLLRIETVLDDLMLPWNIDLCLLSDIHNPALLDHIQRCGKLLWARTEERKEATHAS